MHFPSWIPLRQRRPAADQQRSEGKDPDRRETSLIVRPATANGGHPRSTTAPAKIGPDMEKAALT
ncbi:Uncharacterised protein [Amycolatopsis camponoti]|uniref:Uncharacterized protein n=1 Tax=Amycolatopsis camponoti TaxID=2606593 RepID=A0A6I8M504_9PSEU|nr:Uncharacterised protein [Amycolatopsis camponoti]